MKRLYSSLFAFAALFLSLSLLSCRNSSSDPVVVEVGGESIRKGYIDFVIAQLPEPRRVALEDSAARRAYIQEIVEGKILAIDAERRYGKEGSSLQQLQQDLLRRDFCRYTQSIVIARRLGQNEAELARWISKNREKLGGDTALPYAEMERIAAEKRLFEEVDLEEFYIRHAALWVIPQRIEISAIESKNRRKFQKAVEELKRGIPFEEVASRYSEHHTASQGGYFGWIEERENHFLMRQYDGLREALFGANAVSAGGVTDPFSDGVNQVVVKVNVVEPRRQLTFQEAEKSIRATYLKQERSDRFIERSEELKKVYRIEVTHKPELPLTAPENEVLVTMANKEWIRSSDVARLKEDYPADRSPSDSVVLSLLLNWRLWERYGIDLGLDETKEYQHHRDQFKTAFWLKVENDSLLTRGWGVDGERLKEIIALYPALFEGRTLPEAAPEAALLALGDLEELRAEWLNAPERYSPDSAVAYGVEFKRLFSMARPALNKGVLRRWIAERSREIGVKWVDTLWAPPVYYSASAVIDQAEEMIKSKRPLEAAAMLQEALYLFPTPEPRRDSLTYLLARSLMDGGRHTEAVRVFRRYTLLYPESSSLCRVLFMQAFLLENELKESKLALEPLKRLLKECPDSELVADAQYMVEDIECGHCKTAAFLESISKQSKETEAKGEEGS